MTALVTAVTLALAATGLLDPVALMLSLLAAGAVLRLVPGAARENALSGRRAALGAFYDALERRRGPAPKGELRRRGGAGLALTAFAVLALLTGGPTTGGEVGNERYLAELEDLEDSGVPTGDDPAEGAVALLSGLDNLLEVESSTLVASGSALAFVAAAAATVAVTWRLTGRPLAASLAGGAHILAAQLTTPRSGAGAGNLDLIGLNAAAALVLLAAVLVADSSHRKARLLAAPMAVALAAAFHPLAAAIAMSAGASGLMLAVLNGLVQASAAIRMAVPTGALALVVGAVGADGAVADGLLRPPSPPPLDLTSVMALDDLAMVTAVGVVMAGVGSIVSGPRAKHAPALLALCVLAGNLVAIIALPGNSPLLADEGARIIAAPPVAVLVGFALSGLTRTMRRPHAAAQASAKASRSPS